MDPVEASAQLAAARSAHAAAGRTPVSPWTPPLVGASVFAGFAAAGLLPTGGGSRVAAASLALACWSLAGWLVLRRRSQEGVRGTRGRLRTTATTLLCCALALAVDALQADDDLREVLVGLGVVAGPVLGYLTAHQEHGCG